MAKFTSVDEYLASLEPATAATVQTLIEVAVAVRQDLDVKLSWNVPQVHLATMPVDNAALKLIGVYDFQRMNQVIIAYHAQAEGEVRLSPELVEYQLYAPQDLICWPAGTGYALGDWLRSEGIEPKFMSWAEREAQSQEQ